MEMMEDGFPRGLLLVSSTVERDTLPERPVVGIIGERSRVSRNYGGSLRSPGNISASIADRENCSTWVTNLPANCTTSKLMGILVGTGKVWQTHINSPEPHSGHLGCAAKVTFFSPSGAQALLDRASEPGICVDGRRVAAQRNRTKVAAQRCQDKSRVLVVYGHSCVVNEERLAAVFGRTTFYDTDAVVRHPTSVPFVGCVEWRFGSCREQAEKAAATLLRSHGSLVFVWWGKDPCEKKL